MWTAAEPLSVLPEDRQILERWVRAPSMPQNLVLRARLVLMAAEGAANNRIAAELGVTRSTVILWRSRFAEGGPTALTETAPGRGLGERRRSALGEAGSPQDDRRACHPELSGDAVVGGTLRGHQHETGAQDEVLGHAGRTHPALQDLAILRQDGQRFGSGPHDPSLDATGPCSAPDLRPRLTRSLCP